MLQSELLPIFYGHQEIPETAGMCTNIESNIFIFKGYALWVNRYFFSYRHAYSQVSDTASDYSVSIGLQQPTLNLLGALLNSVTTALERAAEEKSLLLNKVQDDHRLL